MLKRLLSASLVLVLFSGCFKDMESICDYDPCSYKAPASEITAVQNYLSGASINATQHCSGMFYTIETPGTGRTPSICDQIAVRYKGMLTNGNVFDQQTASPVVFDLGRLIEGWKSGLSLLKEGGKMTLYIPPTLGYGNRDVPDNNGGVAIPANSILIFELELVAVY